jgi:hypothetical protein
MKQIGPASSGIFFCTIVTVAAFAGTSAKAVECGQGFVEVASHGEFYSDSFAGRLAYAPLARSVDAAKSAQLFCVFTDPTDYMLPRRPTKLFFVLNNMKTSEEPLGNSYLFVRFVRENGMQDLPYVELWKKESDLWVDENVQLRKYAYSYAKDKRDQSERLSIEAGDEPTFEQGIGVDLHGTTIATETVPGYSTWQDRGRISAVRLGDKDGLKFSVLVFAVRDSPPSYRNAEDRKRRVVFEVSLGTSTSLYIETLGPPGQSSLLTRSYNLRF